MFVPPDSPGLLDQTSSLLIPLLFQSSICARVHVHMHVRVCFLSVREEDISQGMEKVKVDLEVPKTLKILNN